MKEKVKLKDKPASQPVIDHVVYQATGDWIATLTDGTQITLTHWQKVLWVQAQVKHPVPGNPA